MVVPTRGSANPLGVLWSKMVGFGPSDVRGLSLRPAARPLCLARRHTTFGPSLQGCDGVYDAQLGAPKAGRDLDQDVAPLAAFEEPDVRVLCQEALERLLRHAGRR